MKQLSYRDLAIFCEQISMMIKSGIMLHTGMMMITEDTTNPQKKAIFQVVSKELAEGSTLDAALKSTSAFPDYMVYMIEIGTKSGKLDTVINALSLYYNRQHTMKENVKSAIVYPMILIVMMLIVLIFLAAKVLPVFEQVFKSLGTQMSPWATYIMKIGSLFNQYSLFLIILFLILSASGLFLMKSQVVKPYISSFLLGKKTFEKFAVATFTSSMALMLSSGLDTELSIQLSEQAISNRTVKEKINKLQMLMKEKSISFVDAIEEADLLSNTMVGFLSTGYQAGSIDTAMEYIAELYEEEYQSALMRKVSLIEPISIAVISVLIGSILVSVMFPLLGVLSTIG